MAPGAHKDNDTGYTWTKQEDQPAWEWRSTRAREEENRALENIVDLSAQIKSMLLLGCGMDVRLIEIARYGDPLDSTVPMKSKR